MGAPRPTRKYSGPVNGRLENVCRIALMADNMAGKRQTESETERERETNAPRLAEVTRELSQLRQKSSIKFFN